jgi:NitT/TauT family transport system substrate-binding protein
VTPAGIYVPPESPVHRPEELAHTEIAVGYHSGSHFSTIQSLQGILQPDEIKLRFGGWPLDRLAAMLNRQVPAASMFGALLYVLEQQGFRKVLDTTFIVGYMLSSDTDEGDAERYFRALRRAQRDIDLEPERYKHYFLEEIPEQYHPLIDVRNFGPGERLVSEPYTQEMYETTHRWMEALNLFPEEQRGNAPYQQAILA